MAYAPELMRARPYHFSLPLLFRTFLVGMLALAIVGKPVLAELCDAHELMHMMAKVEAGKHDGAAPMHVDTVAEARSDRDHATGAHQQIHSAAATPAYVQPFTALTVPPARFAALAPPLYEALAPAARGFDSPFRPPIA